jgi:predicted RNA binding protein YcfA (HicA-like mRNA interferase family)
MKRKQFVRHLKKAGCVLLRPGSKHDIYLNPTNGKKQPIPRHNEIDDQLAKSERPYQEIMSEIRKRQHDRGHQPSVKEEVDMYLQSERNNWE